MNSSHPFLSQVDQPAVVAAIERAERNTSGEIRVFVSKLPCTEVISAASREFRRLKMDRTEQRNGVLIYLAPESRTFCILGDTGIHQRCGDEFWKTAAAAMELRLREGRFTDGLISAVDRVGEVLKRHFKRAANDRNELPDEIGHD